MRSGDRGRIDDRKARDPCCRSSSSSSRSSSSSTSMSRSSSSESKSPSVPMDTKKRKDEFTIATSSDLKPVVENVNDHLSDEPAQRREERHEEAARRRSLSRSLSYSPAERQEMFRRKSSPPRESLTSGKTSDRCKGQSPIAAPPLSPGTPKNRAETSPPRRTSPSPAPDAKKRQ